MFKTGDLVRHRYLDNHIGVVLYVFEKDNYHLPSWRIPVLAACVMWGKEKLFYKCDIDSLVLIQNCVN